MFAGFVGRMEQGLLVISNAKAGSADERVLQEVLDVLHRGGADVHSETLDSPDQLDDLLGAHPRRLPVAAGGDGTLHLLVAALHARGELASRVIGLVPLGTGNDFARTVGIPLAAAAAARVVLQGSPHDMDLLTDDADGVVINAVHLGIGARGSRAGEPLKPVLGMLAYRIGALLAGLRTPGWPLLVITASAQARPAVSSGGGLSRKGMSGGLKTWSVSLFVPGLRNQTSRPMRRGAGAWCVGCSSICTSSVPRGSRSWGW